MRRLLICLLLFGCEGETGSTTETPADDKYAGIDLPEDGVARFAPFPVGEAVEEDIRQHKYGRSWTFEKKAGAKYRIVLDQLTADLDLYTHYVNGVSIKPGHYQHRPFLAGTQTEVVEFEAGKDGPYYIRVFGFEAGSGRLRVIETNQGVVRQPSARDAVVFAVSGHDFGANGNNEEYLDERGTVDAVADVMEEAGLRVRERLIYSDNLYNRGRDGAEYLPGDAPGNAVQARGFLQLLEDMERVRKTRIEGQARPATVVFMAHSHGTVWAHLALFVEEEWAKDEGRAALPVHALIDFDGESYAWEQRVSGLGVGDVWSLKVDEHMEDTGQTWPFDIGNPADNFEVAGQGGNHDIEDICPAAVTYNIEIAADASEEWGPIQDAEPNHRLDGSQTGIWRYHAEGEEHGEVTQPGSKGLECALALLKLSFDDDRRAVPTDCLLAVVQ